MLNAHSRFRFFLLSFFSFSCLLIGAAATASEYATRLFPATGGFTSLKLQDVGGSDRYTLYTTRHQTVPDIPQEQQACCRDGLYLYDKLNDFHTKVDVNVDGGASNYGVLSAQFAGSDRVYFISGSTDLVEETFTTFAYRLYSYHIASKTISLVESPDSTANDIERVLLNNSGTIAYATFNRVVYRLDTSTKTWTSTGLVVNYNTLFDSISDDGTLLFTDNSRRLTALHSDNSRTVVEESFYNDFYRMTDDGRYAFVYNNDFIRRYDLHSDDNSYVDYELGNALVPEFTLPKYDISGDGRYLVASARTVRNLPSGSSTYGQQALFLVELETGNIARINVFAAEGLASSSLQAQFSADGTSIQFVSDSNAFGYVAEFDLSDDLFVYESPANSVDLASDAPLQVTINGNVQSPYLGITRTSLRDGVQQGFLSNALNTTDYKFGLLPGNYEYAVSLCNENLVCDPDSQVAKEVTVQDFAVVPELTSNLLLGDELGEAARVTFSATGDDDASHVQFVDPASYSTHIYIGSNTEVTRTVSDGKDILMAARYCIQNHDGSMSCGAFSNPELVDVPNFLQSSEIQVLPSPDFSAMSIRWPERDGLTYTLYRQIYGQDYEQVYSGAESKFLDQTVPYGNQVRYNLVQCQGEFCSSVVSAFQLYDRVSTPLTVYARESQNEGIVVHATHRYAFDSLRIYRRTRNTGQPYTFLAELTLPDTRFSDPTVLNNVSYEYKVDACFEGDCSVFATDTASRHVSSSVSALPKAPTKPSISANYFMASTLSWNEVEHADGYLVTAKYLDENHYSYADTGVTYTVVGGSNTTLVDDFFEQFGGMVEYRVQSFKYSEEYTDSIAYRSSPSPVRRHNSSKTADKKALPAHKLNNTAVYENGDVRLRWQSLDGTSNQNQGEYVRIFRKVGDSGGFSQIATVTEGSDLTITDNSLRNTLYEFKTKRCSYITKTCSAYSNTVSFTTDETTIVTELTTAPGVVWQDNAIEISPMIPQSDAIYRVEARLREEGSSYSFTSFSSSDVNQVFRYVSSSLEVGETYYASTRYCAHTLASFNDCFEWSEESQVTLPNSFQVVPSQAYINIVQEDITADSTAVSYRVGSTNSDIARATYLNTFVASDSGELEFSQRIEDATVETHQTYFNVTEAGLATGDVLYFQAQLCNDVGCGPRSDLRTVNAIYRAMPVTLDTPVIEDIEDSTDYDAARLTFTPVDFATSYVVRASSETHNREATYYPISNSVVFSYLQTLTNYEFTIQACNGEICSEESEPYSYLSQGLIKNAYSVSGESLRSVGAGYHVQQNYWHLANGQLSAAHGELDTWRGELNLNSWLDTSLGFSASTRVYLNQNNVNICEQLHGFDLILGENRAFEDSYDHTIFQVFYSGNGCDDYPSVDLFKLFITSPYMSEPLVLENAHDFLEKWLTIEVAFDEDGKMSLTFDGEEVPTSEASLDRELFELVRASWQLGQRSFGSAIDIRSNKLDVNGLFNVINDSSLRFNAPHPRLLEIRRRADMQTQYWPVVDDVVGESVILDSRVLEQENQSAYDFVSGLRPGTDYLYLARFCSEETCSPVRVYKITSPFYGDITNLSLYWSSLQAEGEIPVRIQVSYPYADTYKLFMRKQEEGAEPTQIVEKSYEQIASELDNESYHEYRYVAAGLEPGAVYEFHLEACNPAGCYTQENTLSVTAPMDTDGDGVIDRYDTFPNDPTETYDSDGDGIGNNADEDDDGDGMSDELEILLGLEPLSRYDLGYDMDGDGYFNLIEFLAGSDLADDQSIPSLHHTFVSFESGENYPSVTTKDIVPYLYGISTHGVQSVSGPVSTMESESGSVTFAGETQEGMVTFGFYGRIDLLSVYLDGELIAPTRSQYLLGRAYELWQFPVSEGYHTIEWRLSRSFSDWQGSRANIDGLLIPTGPVGTNVPMDVNSDRHADVLWRNKGTGENRVWAMGDVYADEVIDLIAVEDPAWNILGQGDFNADGYTDLMWRSDKSGDIRLWMLKGSERIANRLIQQVRDETWSFWIGETNGDKVDDVVLHNNKTGMIMNWTMTNGDLSDKRLLGYRRNTEFVIRDIVDFDGNGVEDILWQNKVSGAVDYWLYDQNGNVLDRSPIDSVEETPWKIIDANDFDGDGVVDLVWRNQDTAETRVWYHNPLERLSFEKVKIDTFRSLNWQIVATGDYNGDGKADLFWRNRVNGNNVIFFSTSTRGVVERLQTTAESDLNFEVVH